MTIGEFLHDFWWLIFPVFGMIMAFQGSRTSEQRVRSTIDLIKTYTDQGKEPPPELLKIVSRELQDDGEAQRGADRNGTLWTFIVFAALAAGFGTGWYLTRGAGYEWAFLMITVTMGVLALGSLLVLIFGRK